MQKYKRSNEQDRAHNNLLMYAECTPIDGFKTGHPDKYWRDVHPIRQPSHPRPRDGRQIHHGHHEMWPFQHILWKIACASWQKQTWTEATVFWNEKVNLKRTCAVTTGQYGFGGSTTDTATTDADAAYEQSVHDFSSAFDKSQTKISGLSTTNTTFQQQLQQSQMMCQAMTNFVPPPTYQIPVQTQQQMQSQHQNWKNNNGGG